jgi:hypothetical protein
VGHVTTHFVALGERLDCHLVRLTADFRQRRASVPPFTALARVFHGVASPFCAAASMQSIRAWSSGSRSDPLKQRAPLTFPKAESNEKSALDLKYVGGENRLFSLNVFKGLALDFSLVADCSTFASVGGRSPGS